MALLNRRQSLGCHQAVTSLHACVVQLSLWRAALMPYFFFSWKQGVPFEDVARVLRQRFGTSGIAEKAARRK